MVCWTPGHFRLHALKAEPAQIQLLDEYINDPYRVILSDVVVEMLGEQGALRTIFAFDKSLHRALRCLDMHSVRFYRYTVFSHSLGRHRSADGFAPVLQRTGAIGQNETLTILKYLTES